LCTEKFVHKEILHINLGLFDLSLAVYETPNLWSYRGTRIAQSGVIVLQAEWYEIWIPAGARDFSVLQNDQTSSGAHPASYLMCMVGGLFVQGQISSGINLNTHFYCGSAVGGGTVLQVRRSRVRFLMVSLEFFIDAILPSTIWPWCWLSLYQKCISGIFPVE